MVDRMNKKIIASVLLVAVLFVSAIAETMLYYKNEISNLNSQISKLSNVIANFPTPNITATLGVIEILGSNSTNSGQPTPIPYNYLYITGSISNSGKGTAYNAGLLVVAYSGNGILEVNMTVPLSGGIFGTDQATNTFVSSNYGSSNPTLGLLDGKQTAQIGNSNGFTQYYGAISILHEGTVTNWTITPVWANSPD